VVARGLSVSTGLRKIVPRDVETGQRLATTDVQPDKGAEKMRYVCLIYFDPKRVFDGSAESNALLAEVGPHDRELEASGRMVASEALTLPNEAMTVHVRDGKMSATDGPFMETKEVLAGFILIEARDLNEAVQIAGGFPFAKVGYVEVRPVVDFSQPPPKL
jgi:hypothetical protein